VCVCVCVCSVQEFAGVSPVQLGDSVQWEEINTQN